MARLSDILTTRRVRRRCYRTEFPGFGTFEGASAAEAEAAAVHAFQLFHNMNDDWKRAFILCSDGKTLLFCYATANGWALETIHLDEADPVTTMGARHGKAMFVGREGRRRTWTEFLAEAAEFAATYGVPTLDAATAYCGAPQ
ncbi:hypothetical protein Misp03_36370 [Microbispora sp. NBRC 16548]|nr:hypothetical protein Misp03_36370 [Microbispora sp. NBRC 16548]